MGAPRSWGRNRYLAVVVALVVSAVGVVQQMGSPARAPETADLASLFTCGSDGGGEEPGELDQMLSGMQDALLAGQVILVFNGLAPPGVPVTRIDANGQRVPDGTTDPDTGVTSFSRIMGAVLFGETSGLEFLDQNDVPGSAGEELTFGLGIRGSAGQDGDDHGLKRLFNQNFGLADDQGDDISGVGVDVDWVANAGLASLPSGFQGSFVGVFNFGPEGDQRTATFRVELNSLAEGAAIPEQSSLSFLLKEFDDPHYYALGQTAEFAGFDGETNQPGLAFGLDLGMIDDPVTNPTERDLVAADTSWSAVPRQGAFGFANLCPEVAQNRVAWNLEPGGLPEPEAASLGVNFRLGDRAGQMITVSDGSGGTVQQRASEVVLDASIDGLPGLMDFVMLPDALSFTRSSDVAPDLTLNRFHTAADNPDTADERPLLATGQITDMARHVALFADFDEETGAVQRGELTSWTLRCDGEDPPPGDAAPLDLRRLDRTDTLPSFPTGCERHNLAPVPSAEVVAQNWLPEDLAAQAATADLRPPPLDAAQFGYLASRDVNPLGPLALFAFGAKINGLERATVDHLTQPPPVHGSVTRAYLQRAPGEPTEDSAQLVVDLAPEILRNGDNRVTLDATIDDLPDAIRIDHETAPGRPLALTWRADAPIAIRDGTFAVHFAEGAQFEGRGEFETVNPDGDGPMPPAAHIGMKRTIDAEGVSDGRLYYTAPDAPEDDFPTPEVPDFDPATLTRLHAGAEVTTAADRQANLATRFHADIEVPLRLRAFWTTSTGGRLDELEASMCSPGSRNVPECLEARFDVAVVRGPRSDPATTDLLTSPTMPVPTAPVSDAVPAFTDFRPGSGARAVILGADLWGAEAKLDGLAAFGYRREPLDVRVQVAETPPQPFRVNLLDASTIVETTRPRPQVLFADAALDRLPRNVRIRQRDLGASADEPWLWVNTESMSITEVADVDWTPDAAGSRPRLTGVLRLGDADTLANRLRPEDRPTTARTAPGADLWADYDLDNRLLAAEAVLSLDVPRHVGVWQPRLGHCDDGDEDSAGCPGRRSYEMDAADDISLRFRSTTEELGDLNVDGDIRGDDTHLTARARVDHLPGNLLGNLTIADNLRLPWTTVDFHLRPDENDGRHGPLLGTVRAEVFDRNNPVDYGETGQCTFDGPTPCTPNYAVSFLNVPDRLHVTGRLEGGIEERLTPVPPTQLAPADSDAVPVDTAFGGIGFVHAQLDLHDRADLVTVEARRTGDGQMAGTLEGFHTIPSGPNGERARAAAPISGFLNARIDHVQVRVDPDAVDTDDPFNVFIADQHGLLGLGWCALAGLLHNGQGETCDDGPVGVLQLLGYISVPFLLALDVVAGVVFHFLLDGDPLTDFTIDADLPLLLEFDHDDTVRFGMSGATLSIDERHNLLPGEPRIPALIAIRQQSMSHEADQTVDGAYFHHKDVHYAYDSVTEDHDVRDQVDNAFGDIGIYRWDLCDTHVDDLRCYLPDADNEARIDEVGSATRQLTAQGFDSGDAVVDLFFSPANREELDDEDAGGILEPGVLFYDGLAAAGKPLLADSFRPIPELADEFAFPQPVTFDVSTAYCCNTTTFTTFVSGNTFTDPRSYGPVCELSDPEEVLAGPRAVATDGTEYVAVLQGADATAGRERSFCDASRLVLEAHFPRDPGTPADSFGQIRWTAALPIPRGFEAGGACREENARCEIRVQVRPQGDGSVQVSVHTNHIEDGVDGGDLDVGFTSASGFPEENQGRLMAINACCGEPDIDDGDSTPLNQVRAWVDASGHPGFHRTEAAAVDEFDRAFATTDASGRVSLDPRDIAPDFGNGNLPAGHTVQWLFGDGTMSGRLTGQPATQEHVYPAAPPCVLFAPYLGVLVHYDENDEVAGKAYFNVCGPGG